jgi:WhiB family redox-sensing transcriptional regulator
VAYPVPEFEEAKCRDTDPDFFFPTGPGQAAEEAAAAAFCYDCPEIVPCREWALMNEDFGVWGGLTEADRAAIRKQRRRQGWVRVRMEKPRLRGKPRKAA